MKTDRPLPNWIEGVAWPLLGVCVVIGALSTAQGNWLTAVSMLAGAVLWTSFFVRSRASHR